jgi:hypothetical protein
VCEIDKVNKEKERDVFAILRTEIQKEDPIMTNVEVNGMPLKMEVDTGAAISIGGEEALKNQLGKLVLKPTQILLRIYNGTVEKPLGVANVEVLKDSGELVRLPMVVLHPEIVLSYLVKMQSPVLLVRSQ